MSSSASAASSPFNLLANPRKSFMEAVANGDLATARACLPRLEQILGPCDELTDAAAILAQAGDNLASDILQRMLIEHRGLLSESTVRFAIGGLVQFYGLTDREKEGLGVIDKIMSDILNNSDLSPKDEAYYLNQLQKLRYGAGEYELALSNAERIVELCPDELSYLYNLSLIYQRLQLLAKAVETVDRYMRLPEKEPDDDHLAHAVELYAETGRNREAKEAFQILREKYPAKANRVLFGDDELRKLIASA